MQISELLLPEFDQEMANTRKVLERIPNDKLDWKATSKSNTIGWVASHLVEIPNWVSGTFAGESWDIQPPGTEAYHTPILTSREQMLAAFDKHVAEGRLALEKASNDEFFQSWSLLQSGKPLFTMPRYTVIRSFVINHMIHHRTFLISYLRLNNVAVPGMYGPSGEE
jgi:uncharacterized damage-inducible protein DinB